MYTIPEEKIQLLIVGNLHALKSLAVFFLFEI